ncbi:D-alanyl-D-alanine carboxypeptidase/D-alanyl-D-alanine-endopeptidase [Micromonospora sp. C51]|uniref:D-alanyl-D-alanine carboxypeptidase/D-alanyl-D-alanine endopeptidase n=1 Tax=Micromonospora sp. C51 TaxID=2824879 RepID=UPI001B366C2B|nr:D-alanyl-D-alanine carboxypeptidase/D-alanyl-D-alanine-endopeptidase [Micromonospora sp. C51]MBQ1050998.1 D-alanyl-D-alanine carboxypeptidase/D-alanyl-D-alanine-endopeptidase [Micromonospora sp. C51]
MPGDPPAGAVPPPGGPAPRRRLPLVLAAVLVLVLVAVGLVVVRPGPVGRWLGDAPATPAATGAVESAPVPVLAAADVGAPPPSTDGLRTTLEPLIDDTALGGRVNVAVADALTGEMLFDRGGGEGTVPASVTKLVTAVTVLTARGPGHRIPTRAVAGAQPGEVVLVGGGDPTLAAGPKGFYPGAANLTDLADQVRKALGGVVPKRVVVDSSRYSGPVYEPGWDDDIPTGGYGGAITALMLDGARTNPKAGPGWAERVAEPDLVAGRAFAKLLGAPVDTVRKGTAPPAPAGTATEPVGGGGPGAELGVVHSPPLIRLVDIMISDSDNIVAEALARQVALARDRPASFAGAAAAMAEVVSELALPVAGLDLADGSGLSRDNLISPALLTELLALAASPDRPELAGIFGGLPVAGWSGTLRDRYGATPGTAAGAGVVRAKTGTLTRVHAIAGVVTTAEGRLLTFAVLTDDVPPDGMEPARAALDRIAAALAGCGCR